MRRGGPCFEQVASFGPLCHAAREAARGLKHRSPVAAFLADLEPEVLALERELRDGSYRPRPLTRFRIRDPKPRTISAAAFRDRVVHHALCAGLEPRFERYADFDSYACRKGKGNLAAVERLQALCRQHAWYVKLDVRHFFETVDHTVLLALLCRLVRDRRVMDLAATILAAGSQEPGHGLPIGNLTSQHFGNLLLGRLDHHLRERVRVPAMVRYMDDIVLFGPDRPAARRLREQASAFIENELHQQVKREATQLGPVHIGIPFLGFRVWPHLRRLDGARARRFRGRVRTMERALGEGRVTEAEASRRASALFSWAEQADTWRFRRSFLTRLACQGAPTG
jgi:RNA-directed DNA polymerase